MTDRKVRKCISQLSPHCKGQFKTTPEIRICERCKPLVQLRIGGLEVRDKVQAVAVGPKGHGNG